MVLCFQNQGKCDVCEVEYFSSIGIEEIHGNQSMLITVHTGALNLGSIGELHGVREGQIKIQNRTPLHKQQ